MNFLAIIIQRKLKLPTCKNNKDFKPLIFAYEQWEMTWKKVYVGIVVKCNDAVLF